MQNESLFLECRSPRPVRRRSVSILVVLSGFLLSHATVVDASYMVLHQVYGIGPTVETWAYFNNATISGSGIEYAQVTECIVVFSYRPWYTQHAIGIVLTPPPWPYGTMIVRFDDGVFHGIFSGQYQIRPTENWLGETIAFSSSPGSGVLIHRPCCAGFIEYGLVSSIIERALVDFYLYARFGEHWQQSGCDATNDWCGGADLDQLGNVDWIDLNMFVAEWLNYCPASWSFK